jgi:sugar phosphate isomerase/epimerase
VSLDGISAKTNSTRLAGAAWSWVGATLRESAAIYRALGVDAVDLISIPGSCLDTYEIACDPAGNARRMKDLGATLSNLFVFFGSSFHDRPLNSVDSAVRLKNFETFRRLLDFCVTAGFHSITVLPGVEQPGLSRTDALQYSAVELNRMNEAASDGKITLVYEPHVQSILEDPRDVVKFARENKAVKLVIDYSHAISLGYSTADIDPLIEFAGHVHLRQAAPDKIQARWDEGTIDFPALIRRLKSTGYRGYLTLEYEHDKFWNMDRCDVMTETIKMRDAVLTFLAEQ